MTIDGVNMLTEYGFGISRLSGNMNFLKRKKQAIHSWPDENGEEYMVDQGDYFYEPKDILATCFVHGTSKADFQAKVDSVKTILETPGLRTVSFDSDEKAHLVYAKYGASLSRIIKLNNADNVAKFIVKLREPQPYNIQFKYDISTTLQTASITLSVATGYTVDIHWGDGEVTTGVTGADQVKTHVYPRKNVYYITIIGDLNQVTKFYLFGEELILNGDFADWSGAANPNNIPDYWTVNNNDATNYVADADGECQMISDNTQVLSIEQSIFTAEKWYVLTLNATVVVEGGITVSNASVPILSITTTGIYNIVFQVQYVELRIHRLGITNITFTDVSIREGSCGTCIYGDPGKTIKKLSLAATEFNFQLSSINRYSKSIIPATLANLKLDSCAIISGNDIWQVLKDVINDGVNKLADRPTSMNIWLDGGTNAELPAAGQADYDTIAAYLTTGSIKVNGYTP